MFRALLFLLLISGTPQTTNTDVVMNSNLTTVNNFQVLNSEFGEKENFVSAKGAMAIDLDSHITLYKKTPEKHLPIASLAKLMTALIILEEHNFNEIVTISQDVNSVIGSRMWLYSGEQISVENLLKGMLIQSGNDAAYELAKFNAGTLEEFSKKMNRKAFYLGLKNSHFLDPAGLDDENNYSTPEDLAIIATHILKNDFVRKIVAIQKTSIFSVNGKIEHQLVNTNRLLDSSFGAKGLKTGTTDAAGQCIITLVKVNGNDILIIILGSKDRYKDTRAIFNQLQSVN